MGSVEAGSIYCRYLDSSISRGFNPEIDYKVEQTLYNNPVCIHRINDGELNSKMNISQILILIMRGKYEYYSKKNWRS